MRRSRFFYYYYYYYHLFKAASYLCPPILSTTRNRDTVRLFKPHVPILAYALTAVPGRKLENKVQKLMSVIAKHTLSRKYVYALVIVTQLWQCGSIREDSRQWPNPV